MNKFIFSYHFSKLAWWWSKARCPAIPRITKHLFLKIGTIICYPPVFVSSLVTLLLNSWGTLLRMASGPGYLLLFIHQSVPAPALLTLPFLTLLIFSTWTRHCSNFLSGGDWCKEIVSLSCSVLHFPFHFPGSPADTDSFAGFLLLMVLKNFLLV